MTALPRFVASSEGPFVIDRDRALRAEFASPLTSQQAARLLNANPAMVDAFHWTNDNQGDTQ